MSLAVRVAVWALAFSLVWGLLLVFAQGLHTRSAIWIVATLVLAVVAFVFASVTWSRLGRRSEP